MGIPAGAAIVLRRDEDGRMTHQVLEEIVRAKMPIRPEVFKRWQQAIRELLNTPDEPATKKARA